MKLTIRPLTPALWPALEDLFGENGACNGCWCMYWRIGSAYRKRPREQNKAAFRAIVKRGPPPGLLAFDGEAVVGWCQLTPRAALPWLDRAWRLKRVDGAPVWSLSCFWPSRVDDRSIVENGGGSLEVTPSHDCGLCHLDGNPDQRVIFRHDTVLQNEKEQGALRGSGVIIPVRHAETVFDLTPEEIDATFALLKEVKAWMDEQYHPDGYNVGWNCRPVGGQIDMHAHMHVIPRFRQEPYAGRGIRYWLKQPGNRWW